MDSVSKAVELFRGGCACSQAILAAFGLRYGLGEPLAMRVAAGFAGGMRMAETCGAVTGAYNVERAEELPASSAAGERIPPLRQP